MFTRLANCFQTVQPNVADNSQHIFPLDDANEQLQGFSTLGFQRYEPDWMKVRFVVDKGGQSSQRPDFGRVRRSLEAVFDAANLDYDPLVTICVGDHSSSAHIGFMIDPNDIDKVMQTAEQMKMKMRDHVIIDDVTVGSGGFSNGERAVQIYFVIDNMPADASGQEAFLAEQGKKYREKAAQNEVPVLDVFPEYRFPGGYASRPCEVSPQRKGC